jgi:hypothetical protein
MRKLALPLLAAFATFGLVAIPASAGVKLERKQNKSIKKLAGAVGGVKSAIKNIEDINLGQTASVNDAHAKADTLKKTVDAIVAIAGSALPALENGLKAAAAGLTTLASAYQSVEYGIAGISVSGVGVVNPAGGSAMSADIPDDGNTIHVGDTAILVNATGGSVSTTVNLNASIRSNEGDGAAGATAGQAGGFMYVVNLDTGERVACTGAPNPPGIVGTVAGDSIVTPSGTVTNLSLKNLPGGLARTDTSAPATTIAGPCIFSAAAVTTYGVTYSVNFVDVPTSTSPGATE